IYSVGLGDMSQLVQKFSELYPPARVQVEYVHPNQVYERVLQEQVDFGLVSYPLPRRELTVIPWHEEPMVLACHAKHRLACQQQISLLAIEGEKFIGFTKELVIRKQIDRLLQKHGVS